LVTRARAPRDARRVLVVPTAAGRRALAAAPAAPQERLIAHLAARPSATRRRLASEMERLAAAVSPAARPAPMFFAEELARRGAGRRA
jgi:DNA-binding MarR family transcriptional regulator